MLRAHFRDVWRIVRRFGVPENSADDAAQEVFIIAARRLSDIAPGSERPFLFASAVRVAANARRALGARRECAEDDSLPEGVDPRPNAEALLDQKRLRQLLDRVLDELSDDLRVCFVLYELEGMSSPEIAELLSIPVGTVASRLRRAREAFEHAAVQAQGAPRNLARRRVMSRGSLPPLEDDFARALLGSAEADGPSHCGLRQGRCRARVWVSGWASALRCRRRRGRGCGRRGRCRRRALVELAGREAAAARRVRGAARGRRRAASAQLRASQERVARRRADAQVAPQAIGRVAAGAARSPRPICERSSAVEPRAASARRRVPPRVESRGKSEQAPPAAAPVRSLPSRPLPRQPARRAAHALAARAQRVERLLAGGASAVVGPRSRGPRFR